MVSANSANDASPLRDPDALDTARAGLRLSEARLRGVFESVSDAIVIADDTMVILLANPAAAQMFRLPLAELIGSPLARFVPERHRTDHARRVHEFGSDGPRSRRMSLAANMHALRADGEEFPVDASISHLRVDGQSLYTAVLRDITEYRRAEEALRTSEMRFRNLLSMLPDAVLVTDGLQVTFVNEAALRLLGRPPEELLGRLPFHAFHPDSVPLVQARAAALRRGESVPTVDEMILRPDGTVREVESTAARIADHVSEQTAVVLRDVTELRHAQRELAASHDQLRRLVAAQQAVREDERRRIARELHDDLQQSLAAIRLELSELAAQWAGRAGGAEQRLAELDKLVGATLVSTRRLIDDLRPQVLDDLGLVPALEMLAAQFEQRTGVPCTFRCEPSLDDLVLETAQATCLYRVAQEALHNVAKHAHAHRVALALARDPDGGLVLSIGDDGEGMNESDRRKEHAFGLLGMRERLQALGGRLQVSSRRGHGTQVLAQVPLPAP